MSFLYLEVSLGLLCQLVRLHLRNLGYVCSCYAVNTSGAFRFVLNKDCIAGFSASSQLDLLEMLVCIIVAMNPFVLLLTSEGAVLACEGFG